jgi:hypothetical protein
MMIFGMQINSSGNPARDQERNFFFFPGRAGLPDFFGTTYQNGEKYTKLPQNIPNGHKILSMAVK